MKIGELAKITKTQVETIRFYERVGLLEEPPRSEGNYRLYKPEHLDARSLCAALPLAGHAAR